MLAGPNWLLDMLKGRGNQRPQQSPVKAQLLPPHRPRPKGTVLNEQIRRELVDVATAIADKYGLPRNYFIAQIQRESGFNPTARGKAGEIGIAQIIPKYHPGVNPHDPVQSLDYLARFLVSTAKQMAAIYGPDMALPAAMAAWNAGTPTIASGRIPEKTVDYIRNIFGPEVAHELVARATGRASPPAAAWIAGPTSAPPVPPIKPLPPALSVPDPRLRLVLEGLMLLQPEILTALPQVKRAPIEVFQQNARLE
jgi:soluble lytic murein transglycosylase-like protein